MIDKINKQFLILSTQTKRFQKLSQSYTVEKSLFSSYMGAVKSVTMISSNIFTSFIELLNQDQIKVLLKNNYSVINNLIQKMNELNIKVQQMKKQKQNKIIKGNNQNCSICGENIHQSNIKQAKIYLQQQSRQNFQLAMEQFKKIAEQPINTKEENNQFQQKLHFQLSQRQRILNTNCNRIEEYLQVMEGALTDLMKIKQIQLNQNQMSHIQFINMNKINEDVSNFLQNSFSKKIPAWIHKMFLRMVTRYIQMCSQRKMQKSTQTTVYQAISSKQVRQYIKQKRQLQKQNKQLNDQLKQLKVCYKKLQQINMQQVITIASMSKNIRYRTPQVYRQVKSRRNSKHTIKGEKDKQQIRAQTASIEDQNENQESDMNNEINITKKKANRLFPQIKRNKNQNTPQKKLNNRVQITQIKKQSHSNDKSSSGRLTQRSKQITSIKKIYDQVDEVQSRKEENQNQKKKKKKQKQQKQRQILKEQKQYSRYQQRQQSKQNNIKQKKFKTKQNKNSQKSKYLQNKIKIKQIKQIQKNIKNKNIKLMQKNRLTKEFNNKIEPINSSLVGKQQPNQQSGIRELYDYVANLTLNKKNNQPEANIKQKTNSQKLERQIYEQTYLQKGVQYQEPDKNQIITLGNYNKVNNSRQLVIIKKVSQDLSQKIKIKKNSIYSSFDTIDQQANRISVVNKNTQIQQSSNIETQKLQHNSKHPSRYQETNKQNFREYLRNCRDSKEVHQRSCESYILERDNYSQLSQKHRNSQITNNIQAKKRKFIQNSLKNSKISDKSNNSQQAKLVQRKIFQILKSNQIISNSVNYKLFSSLIQKINPHCSNQQENNEKSNHNHEIKRQDSQTKLQPEEAPQQILQQAHNSIYGRLFLNKAIAYKYEQSMAKSYHKKILKELNEAERDYCYQMYSNLCQAKKIHREAYHQLSSILRYPYQTLYNNFQVVNFMSDMSFDTFEYFFKKIVWIHRKCIKNQDAGVCLHIQSVSNQLKDILELKK